MHFCLWAMGQQIGDFAEVSLLGAIEGQVERSLLFTGNRFRRDLDQKSPEHTFRIIHAALYGDDERDSDVLSREYGGSNLSDLGASAFDDLFVFLVDRPRDQLLVWRSAAGQHVCSATLPPRCYDVSAAAFLMALEHAQAGG